MESRLVITKCAGYIFWQFFFCEKYRLSNSARNFRKLHRYYPGLQIHVQHWGGGDNQHILVNFLILGGDDFKISCLGVEKPMISTHSSKNFLMTFFLLKSKLLGGWRSNIGGMYPPGIFSPGITTGIPSNC